MVSSPPGLPEVCRYFEQVGLGIEEEVQGGRFLCLFLYLGKGLGLIFCYRILIKGELRRVRLDFGMLVRNLVVIKRKGVCDDGRLP